MRLSHFNEWLRIFHSCLRRKPLSKKYDYRFNTSLINSSRVSVIKGNLTNTAGSNLVEICSNSDVFHLGLKQLRLLLLNDIGNPVNTVYQFKTTNETVQKTTKLTQWHIIAPLFINNVSTHCTKIAQNSQKELSYKYLVKLSSTRSEIDGSIHEEEVAWPDINKSLSCAGIGLPLNIYEKYKKLKVEFLNPLNNKILPIYIADEIMDMHKAIGLFPLLNEKHKTLVSDIDISASLVNKRHINEEMLRKMQSLIVKKLKYVGDNEVQNEQVINMQIRGYDDPITLSEFLKITRKYKNLWSYSDSKYRSCPADIIRNTILSKNFTIDQLTEELFKHFVAFNIMSLTWRLSEKLSASLENTKNNISMNDYKASDLFIQKMGTKVTNRSSWAPEEVEKIKFDYDNFLMSLYYYYCIIIAEMKMMKREFFRNQAGKPSRALIVYTVFFRILSESTFLKQLYPGLYDYLLLHCTKPHLKSEGSIENSLSDSANISRLLDLIKGTLEFESIIFNDIFDPYTLFLKNERTPNFENWKIIVLTKEMFDDYTSNLIKYNSKVFTQVVETMDKVSKFGYSNCISKKMIDKDTFIFLFRINNEDKVETKDMIDNILKTLEVKK